MLVHANVERQPPEESGFGAPFGVVAKSETAAQLQLFSIEGPRTEPLQPSDEEFPDDLVGMYYLG